MNESSSQHGRQRAVHVANSHTTLLVRALTPCEAPKLTIREGELDLDLATLSDPETADGILFLLEKENAESSYWTTVAGEHWRNANWGRAESVLQTGIKCVFSWLVRWNSLKD